MFRVKLIVIALAAVALAGCGAVRQGVMPGQGAGENEPGAASLLAADRAFAAMAQSEGHDAAWRAYMAPEAKLLSSDEPPVEGAAAIAEVMAALPEGAALNWSPQEAVVAHSGELGVTWGEYRLTIPDAEPQTGRYMTVWRKDVRNEWRVILDFGA